MAWQHTLDERIYEGADGQRASVYPAPHGGGLRVCCEHVVDGDAYECTYGYNAPLTRKMAEEIAARFVAGKKIPKRLEWR
jgi:hypothetical protein